MNNPKNEGKNIRDLISDVRSQLLNIQESMELASIAASTLQASADSLAAFIDLIQPIIGYAADQLEDVDTLIYEEAKKEESA